jgi:hydroxymethylglutaryl-CoA lyase
MAEQCGYETGIDVPALRAAVALAERLTQRPLGGRTSAWLRSEDRKRQRDRERELDLAGAQSH